MSQAGQVWAFNLRPLPIAAVALLLGWSAAHAVSLEHWTNRAMDLVAMFEGSDFGAITTDVDCQGLSLGKRQHTIRGNSVKNIFEEVISLVGRPGLDSLSARRSATRLPSSFCLWTSPSKTRKGKLLEYGPGKRSSGATGGRRRRPEKLNDQNDRVSEGGADLLKRLHVAAQWARQQRSHSVEGDLRHLGQFGFGKPLASPTPQDQEPATSIRAPSPA